MLTRLRLDAPLARRAADRVRQARAFGLGAVEGAAAIAVAATATIPQLGFVHEDSGQSFVLDVADLVRDTVTIPCAFKAAAIAERRPAEPVERVTRRLTGERLRRDGVIPLLIERIKTILSAATSEEVAAPALRKRKEELDSHGADRSD